MLLQIAKTVGKYILLFAPWVLVYIGLVIFDTNDTFLPWTDIKLYEHIGRALFDGNIPYIDVMYEYPPGSIVPFSIPAIFTNSTEMYRRFFEIMALLAMYGTILYGYKIAQVVNEKTARRALYLLAFFFLLIIQIVISKFDIFAVLLASAGLYYYISGYVKKTRTQKLGIILITLGGFIKLYPFLILPILVIREYKLNNIKKCKNILITSFAVSIPFFLLFVLGREGLSNFIHYHAGRGLEIESTFASVLLFLNQVNLLDNIEIIYTHASYGIAGPITNFFSNVSGPLFLLCYGTLLFFCTRTNWKKNSSAKLITVVFTSILTFILTNKVFSAQYFQWLFPFVILLLFFIRRRWQFLIGILLFVSTLLTVNIYPRSWNTFVTGELDITIQLLIRNILLLLILVLSFVMITSQFSQRYVQFPKKLDP